MERTGDGETFMLGGPSQKWPSQPGDRDGPSLGRKPGESLDPPRHSQQCRFWANLGFFARVAR
jgi:hypothetical protein